MKITVIEGLELCSDHMLKVLPSLIEERNIYFNDLSCNYCFFDFKWRGFWIQSVNGISVDEFEIRVERI